MAESFKLELPEPDPDEEPLEVEGEVQGPKHIQPAQLPPWLNSKSEEEQSAGQNTYLPPETEFPPDPDALWEANEAQSNRELIRFTLAELMVFTLLISVMLTVARFVSLPALAGFLGAAVLLGLVFVSSSRGSRSVYLCWITLLISYVLVAIWAAIRAV